MICTFCNGEYTSAEPGTMNPSDGFIYGFCACPVCMHTYLFGAPPEEFTEEDQNVIDDLEQRKFKARCAFDAMIRLGGFYHKSKVHI